MKGGGKEYIIYIHARDERTSKCENGLWANSYLRVLNEFISVRI